jgi:hypothetical protein
MKHFWLMQKYSAQYIQMLSIKWCTWLTKSLSIKTKKNLSSFDCPNLDPPHPSRWHIYLHIYAAEMGGGGYVYHSLNLSWTISWLSVSTGQQVYQKNLEDKKKCGTAPYKIWIFFMKKFEVVFLKKKLF